MTCQYLQHENGTGSFEQILLSKDAYPDYFRALEDNPQVAVTDVKNSAYMAELTEAYLVPNNILSKLDCIIMSDTGVAGILSVETTQQQRQWHSEEQRFMLTMSSIASTILTFIELKQLNEAYQHTHTLLARTSELATIGLWEVSLPNFDIHWDKVTRKIHEVDDSFLPEANTAIEFYAAGENRTRIQQLLEQTINENISFDDSFEIITAKGNRKWVRSVGEADFVNGECRRVYGLFQDITEAKQSYQALHQANTNLSLTQERLDIACQNARLGFWQAWPETGELWWSSVVYQIFGFDEATTKPSIELFEQAVHPDDIHILKASEQKAEESGVHDIVHRIILPNGEVRWVHELAKLVAQSDKGLPTLVGSVQDITAKIIAEQGTVSAKFSNRLRHKDGHHISLEWFTAIDPDSGKLYSAAQDVTERLKLEQLKSEFISTVSHELRTPITSISGALSLVLSGVVGEVTEESKKLLNIANSNCKRLANLINDLLDIEKLHAGKMQVELKTHFLTTLLQRAVEENQTYSNKQSLKLSLQLPAEAQDWQVRVDEFRFLQIMANLISNAIKFSEQSSEVIISATLQQSMLTIAVTDFGSGIAEQFKGQIFEKFSQADASDAREKGGTGLGLALSKQLAEAMSGTLSFDSTFGEGSTFYVHLPIANNQ